MGSSRIQLPWREAVPEVLIGRWRQALRSAFVNGAGFILRNVEPLKTRRAEFLSGAVAVCAMGLVAGCDRKTGVAAPPPALMAVNASPADVPVATSLSIRPLATLNAGRATQLAPMPDGTVFVLQSASDPEEGGTVLRVINGRVERTNLTANVVLESLGINRGGAKGAETRTGQFTAIAACADGRLAFSFAGVDGTRPFAAVGTYMPPSGELFVSVDFVTLATVDPTLSTDGGRPSLFTESSANGIDAWLWRATGSEVRLLTIGGLTQPRPKLGAVTVSLDKVKDVIERSAWEWSATPSRGEFLLTDTASRWIRKIDQNGTMSHVARFDDQTVTTITPAALDAAGRMVVLGNDRDGVSICALVQDGEAFRAILREHFAVEGLAETAPLRIDRLYMLPGERNVYAAYEATSGRIVRVELK